MQQFVFGAIAFRDSGHSEMIISMTQGCTMVLMIEGEVEPNNCGGSTDTPDHVQTLEHVCDQIDLTDDGNHGVYVL